MKKKDYLYMLVLTIIPLFMVFIVKSQHLLFGNSIDWFNQHVTLADALRHAIRSEGTIFPTYLSNLMSGVNIYHFSYYGTLRFDVLLGALLIHVKMVNIIIFYQVFLIILTLIACYLFLRNHLKNRYLCFLMSLFTLLSALFFQFHKQIMFVNYMPFLFLMLRSIDRYFISQKITSIVIWGSCIVLHSYFYCVGCFIVCFIYFMLHCYRYKNYKKHFLHLIAAYLLIVLLTAIYTIPTLFVIAGGNKSVNATNYLSLLIPTFSLKGLLYNNYGCGLTYMFWVLIVFGLFKEKTRTLSIILMISMLCPIVSLIMNGFLYARSKILIVFLPLVILQAGLVLENNHFKINKYMLFLFVFPLFFIQRSELVFLDLIISLIILYFSKTNKKRCFIYLLVPLFVVYYNNPTTSFLPNKQYKKYANQEVETLIQRNFINTLVNMNEIHQNMNQTYQNQVTRLSGYTSTNHHLYNSFLFDTLKIPISLNNRVGQIDQNNLFYLKMLSVDSIISKKKIDGYQEIDAIKDLKLYQSQDIMPIAYATNKLYSQNQFHQLQYPYTLDILYKNAIVKNGNSTDQSQFIKEDMGLKSSYQIQQKKNKKITFSLQRKTKNQIIVIEGDIKNYKPHQSVSITINGIKNKLSRNNSPYYNQHTHFTYLLSGENIKTLSISLSKGHYDLKNIKTYSLNKEVIENRNKEVDSLNIQKGKDVLKGSINVKNDGYFITRIPYDRGYTIYIDGKVVKSEIVNEAFLGCPINQGKHKIQIKFTPTGYRLGFILSYFGFMVIFINYIIERRRKNEG